MVRGTWQKGYRRRRRREDTWELEKNMPGTKSFLLLFMPGQYHMPLSATCFSCTHTREAMSLPCIDWTHINGLFHALLLSFSYAFRKWPFTRFAFLSGELFTPHLGDALSLSAHEREEAASFMDRSWRQAMSTACRCHWSMPSIIFLLTCHALSSWFHAHASRLSSSYFLRHAFLFFLRAFCFSLYAARFVFVFRRHAQRAACAFLLIWDWGFSFCFAVTLLTYPIRLFDFQPYSHPPLYIKDNATWHTACQNLYIYMFFTPLTKETMAAMREARAAAFSVVRLFRVFKESARARRTAIFPHY